GSGQEAGSGAAGHGGPETAEGADSGGGGAPERGRSVTRRAETGESDIEREERSTEYYEDYDEDAEPEEKE
ncbi:MAG: hypothetical protein ACUVV6_09185, partial [Thermoplasmatota archaeon]